MELRGLGGALWRQRLLVLLVLLVVAAGVVAGVLLRPGTWTSTVVLEARADPAVVAPAGSTRAQLRVLAAAADDPSVLADAAAQAGLGGQDGPGGPGGPDEERLEGLREQVTALAEPGDGAGGLLRVSASTDEPATAQRLAAALADVLRGSDAAEGLSTTVVQPAERPTDHDAPDLGLAVPLGGLVALAAAAAVALARDSRTHTVVDGAAVERATSAPLLAHLRTPPDPAVLPALEPGTSGASVFAGLLAAVRAAVTPRLDRLVLAGTGPGEAPAWVGANLAVTLAIGSPTLLVDARLGPRYGRPGPGEPDTPGLQEVLQGADLHAAVSPGPVPGLWVLPPGGMGLEPEPGLLERRFAVVAEQARGRFTTVVVVAPPLDASDDARTMAAGSSLLVVVPEDRLTSAELRAHADRVRAAGARLLGAVLVAAPVEPGQPGEPGEPGGTA